MNEYRFSIFGNRLKVLREEQGLKQGQFADMIGITRQSMSNYESGKHSPDVDVIVKMAHALNCSTDYLMGLTEHSNYNRQVEFDDSITKLSNILFSLPESFRVDWLDTFIATAEWLGKDLDNDVHFHFSTVLFFRTLSSLIDSCLTKQEKQSYTAETAQKMRDNRFELISMLRKELNTIDIASYEAIEQIITESTKGVE